VIDLKHFGQCGGPIEFELTSKTGPQKAAVMNHLLYFSLFNTILLCQLCQNTSITRFLQRFLSLSELFGMPLRTFAFFFFSFNF